MPNHSEQQLRAMRNGSRAFGVSRALPHRVFEGDWTDFLFFDADWMIDRSFSVIVNDMIEIEGASVACMINLDLVSDKSALPSFFIDHDTTPTDYQSALAEGGPASAWVYTLPRLGCVSDKGEWCIYGEIASEIALVGFRPGTPLLKFMTPLALVHATRLDVALREPPSYAFSAGGRAGQWRDELLLAYGEPTS